MKQQHRQRKMTTDWGKGGIVLPTICKSKLKHTPASKTAYFSTNGSSPGLEHFVR